MSDELYISPAGASDGRRAMLPSPSEDASHILKPIPTKEIPATRDSEEYLPTTEVDWIIDIIWKDDVPRPVSEIAELLRGKHWDELGSKTDYGKNADSRKWTYLVSGNGPTHVTALKVAWSYFAAWRQQTPNEQSVFEKRLETLDRVVSRWAGATIRFDVPSHAAAQRSLLLTQLHERLDVEIAIQLKAPFLRKFDGKKVWDTLTSLGLEWGDMDCFHWRNDSGVGTDMHFSVWTSTPPGYFLPEEIAAGTVKFRDLIFGFSLPRSADPQLVYERMLAAARYAQQRLGGNLLENSQPPDQSKTSTKINSIATELTSHGFRPGSSPALQLF